MARVSGGRLLAVQDNPRRSRTAERLGSQWLPVLPGTDSAPMAAVLHVLLSESLVDRRHIEATCGAVNVLTSTTPTLPSHGARTHSCAVRVDPAAERA